MKAFPKKIKNKYIFRNKNIVFKIIVIVIVIIIKKKHINQAKVKVEIHKIKFKRFQNRMRLL